MNTKSSRKATTAVPAARKTLPAPHAAPILFPVRLPIQVGQILFVRRKTLRLSQTEEAVKLGISQSRYSELETHPGSMSVEQLCALAGILGAEILMRSADEPRPASAAEW